MIDLHNFAFARESGWNGYAIDFNILKNAGGGTIDKQASRSRFTITSTVGHAGMSILFTDTSTSAFNVKVTGLTEGDIIIQSRNSSIFDITITSDGLYEIPASETGIQIRSKTERESCNIVFEQLPLYPGALVSDGVDDYGVTREAVNERIGTVLIHCEKLSDSTKWRYYSDGIVQSRIYIAYTPDHTFFTNLKVAYKDNNMCIGIANNSPQGNDKLYIAANNASEERGNIAIYRFIIIQEQLNDAQVDFLRWKVEKEYRDWCKANGYEYAINQLTA